MQGLILAAGMGKRLKDLTRSNTKCMVRVNGVTLIERVLRQLEELRLSRIIIVVGYEGRKLIDFIGTLDIKTPVCFVDNPIYDRTNNIYSLGLAKEYLVQEDTLLLESDLIFEDSVLRQLTDDPRDTLALVDKYEAWMNGTCIRVGEDDSIVGFISGSKFLFEDAPDYYKTVNIYKFSRHFSEKYYVPFLEAYSKALGNNEYYEQVLRVITMLDEPVIKAKKLSGQLWYEIDDIQDLDIAASIFAEDADEKTENMQSRYGGYWRYPHLLDFCYLTNPYFPPRKLTDEMKASFETLLTRYPSGMRVNSLLAAKNFGVHQEHILAGNGAAELIKDVMGKMKGRTGFIRPTFEEYPNRYGKEDSVCFTPDNAGFSYSADDVMTYFADKGISALVLINPDNPSGNYIVKKDVLRLAEWCGEKGIKMILDESFVDFADEEDGSLISEDIINAHRSLIIIRSISKSYGVPGLRLGVLVSADEELIAQMKKEAAIWNINSFAEFYMQIADKYKTAYLSGLERFRNERLHFVSALKKIDGLRVTPTQANYVMAQVSGMTARELTKKLLLEHNILIKDLSGKEALREGEYIRLAIRGREDNERLIRALKEIL